MLDAIVALGVFVSGFVLGWLARGVVKAKKDPTKHVVACLIVLTWATSTIVDMVSAVYATPWPVHLLVGGVVGWLFGVNPLKGLGAGNGKDTKG
jgi:hypothetical protein